MKAAHNVYIHAGRSRQPETSPEGAAATRRSSPGPIPTTTGLPRCRAQEAGRATGKPIRCLAGSREPMGGPAAQDVLRFPGSADSFRSRARFGWDCLSCTRAAASGHLRDLPRTVPLDSRRQGG